MVALPSDLLGTLSRLLEACQDREQTYRGAAAQTRHADLQALFRAYAEQRARDAAELLGEARRSGAALAGTPARMAALAPGDPEGKAAENDAPENALIAACAQGEEAAKEAFEAALKEDLPLPLAALIQRQFASSKEAHLRVRELKAAVRPPA